MLEVREIVTDVEVAGVFSLMAQLRSHLKADTFVQTVQRQRQTGYRLFGGFVESKLVTLAGVREASTLMRGPHLFVDDLVTDSAEQLKGHGAAMLRWLAGHAADRGFTRLYLDSRDTAIDFYRRLGFQPMTSVPCWIAVDRLTG